MTRETMVPDTFSPDRPILGPAFARPGAGRRLAVAAAHRKNGVLWSGPGGGPQAIIAASRQIETFDEETLVEFAQSPRIHVLPAVRWTAKSKIAWLEFGIASAG